MYAIVKTGGKQYRVTKGQELNVEKLDCAVGETIHLDQVLMLTNGENVTIGKVNVDHNQPLSSKYKVRNIPTLVMYKEGKEIKRYVGVKNKKFLLKEIEKNQ